LKSLSARPSLTVQSFGHDSLAWLRESGNRAENLRPAYFSVAERSDAGHRPRVQANPYKTSGLHGDLHVGNLLWRGESLYMVVWTIADRARPFRTVG